MQEIVVLSGKGGTGKTSITAALATLGQNMLVADCDVDAANMHLILQPENYREEVYVSGSIAHIDADKCTLCGLCVENCRFDALSYGKNEIIVTEPSCESCFLCATICPEQAIDMMPCNKSRWYEGTYRKGFLLHARLYPGEQNSGKLVSVIRKQARELAKVKQIDTILLDGPPGVGCPVISAVTGTQKVLIVTEPSMSAFHDLLRIVELTRSFKSEIYIIINKYSLSPSVSQKIEQWCEEQNLPIIAKLPYDKTVIEAMLQCKSIVELYPESGISKQIKHVYKILFANE